MADTEDSREKRQARMRFVRQRLDAKRRNVPFLLTFGEWLKIWQDSGKWEHRGRRKGQYVMARFGDVGPYEIGNVRICTVSENQAEMYSHSSNERLRMLSQGMFKGMQHSAETRGRMTEAAYKREPVSAETRQKMSASAYGRPPFSDETRRKMSESHKARWARKRAE